MTEQQTQAADNARTWARVAHEGFADAARYLRSVPEEEWSGPTGAEKWTIRDLAGHVVGEAVWFPNLVRGATQGEAPHPMSLYDELNRLPPEELAARTEDSARQIEDAVGEAIPDQLEERVNMGFARLPIWQATFISASEAVFHNWDARARRDSNPTVPTDWAVALSDGVIDFGAAFAHRRRIPEHPGVYLLQVGDGIGPVTVTARGDNLTVERGAGTPDVTLHLTADQFVRLLVGRFKLDSPQGRSIRIEGDQDRAAGLNRIFGGIANEE